MTTPALQAVLELSETQKYLETQRGLVGPECMKQQAEIWATRLSATSINAQEAIQVIEVIKSGPWSADMQQQLGIAVNTAVLSKASGEKTRRENQHCSDFSRYFSANDLRILGDERIPSQRKLEQVAFRMRAVALMLPTEVTLRHVFSVSLCAGLQCQKDPSSLSTTLRELKRILKACCKNSGRLQEHIVKYPASPEELPGWLFKAAYEDGDPPQSLQITTAEIAGQAAAVALRSNNKLLPQNQKHMQAGAMVLPQNQQQMHAGAMMNGGQCDPMAAMQSMCQLMMQMFQGQVQQPDVPSLHLMKPKEKTTLALPGPTPPAPAPALGPLALTNGATGAASSAASEEVKTPAKSVSEAKVETPAPKALVLPEMSPEAQVKTVAAATGARKLAREAAKENEVIPDSKKAPAKAKAKAKGKAKAKAVAKGKAKATKGSVANTQPEGVAREAVPPFMKKGDPTVHYRGGKLHRNTDCFRVFVKAADRCDRKVRIVEGQEQECWLKAIGLIDARLDAVDVE